MRFPKSTLIMALIVSMFVNSCGPTPQPSTQPPQESPETEVPKSLQPPNEDAPSVEARSQTTRSYPFVLPVNPIYIAVDESTSMSRKSGSCDPKGYRYQIPLFLARQYQDWTQKGLPVSSPINLAYMAGGIDFSVGSQKIIDGLIAKTKIDTPPQYSTILFQALFQKLSLTPTEKDVIVFTDGDFRENPGDTPNTYQQNAVSDYLDNIFQNPETKNSRIFIVLLCSDRLDSQIEWWRGVNQKRNTWVYELDSTTTIDDVTEALLKDMYTPENVAIEDAVLRTGWKLITSDEFIPIPKDSLHIAFGASAILVSNGAEESSIKVMWNNDGKLPDLLTDLWPRGDCKNHALRVVPGAESKLVFVWWQAQPLGFTSILSSNPAYIYNNEQKTLYVSRKVVDKKKELDDSSFIDWHVLDKCLPPTLKIDNASYEGFSSVAAENIDFIVNGLPEGFDINPLLVRLNVSDQEFFAGKLYRRYFPIIDNNIPIKFSSSKSYPTPGEERIDIDISVPFKYFAEKFYPKSIDWKPVISFSNGKSNCVLKDNYLPGIGKESSLAYVDPITVGLVSIHLNNVRDATRKCVKMKIDWGKTWGEGGWVKPPVIECDLHWAEESMACYKK